MQNIPGQQTAVDRIQTVVREPLNVMTFNIRNDTWFDFFHSWNYRKKNVITQLLSRPSHIIGIQEAFPNQMKDLIKHLTNNAYVGVGREGNDKSEHTPIFYDPQRLEAVESETFWLSESPGTAGQKGWDARIPRIVSWAKFLDRSTRRSFLAFNTHFANNQRDV